MAEAANIRIIHGDDYSAIDEALGKIIQERDFPPTIFPTQCWLPRS